MLKINAHIHRFLAAAIVPALLGACSDKWDDHYDPDPSLVAADQTVYEMVKSDPALSQFGKMIEVAGYADLLNTSQTFTLWVPDNRALADVDLTDVAEVKRIVANHMARFNISTANGASRGVRMYNGKVLYFDGASFGGARITRSDIVLNNGVVHLLGERIPYSYNIREYIDTHSNTTMIREFLSRFDEERFDEASSAPIDIDENGNTIYDSVKVVYNRLFEHPVYGLGNILAEDSVFTMVIPDDNAWAKAYGEISSLFKVYNADQAVADSIQQTQTCLAIVRDLVFRQRITDPLALGTITTTSGSKLFDPQGLFRGSEQIQASNGMIYLSSQIDYPREQTYFKPVEVEAENANGRVRGANTIITTRTVGTSNPLFAQVSKGGYIELSGSSPSTQPSVTFNLPDVLSGKYDIYAVFAPASIEDATVAGEQTKLRFVLSYMGANGRTARQTYTSNDFITSPVEMTTIKVASGFEFPVSNFYDSLWLMDDANDESAKTCTTTLFVQTNVSNSEFNSNKFVRRFRIDRIYLVPSEL